MSQPGGGGTGRAPWSQQGPSSAMEQLCAFSPALDHWVDLLSLQLGWELKRCPASWSSKGVWRSFLSSGKVHLQDPHYQLWLRIYPHCIFTLILHSCVLKIPVNEIKSKILHCWDCCLLGVCLGFLWGVLALFCFVFQKCTRKCMFLHWKTTFVSLSINILYQKAAAVCDNFCL